MKVMSAKRERRATKRANKQEAEEQEKIDQFYELIRKFNEARSEYHRYQQQQKQQHREMENKLGQEEKVEEDEDPVGMVRKQPSFKWEDFRAHKKRKLVTDDDDDDEGVSSASSHPHLDLNHLPL